MSSPRKGNNPSPTQQARNFARPSVESTTSSAWETIHSSNSSISISEASSPLRSAKPQRPAFKKDGRPTSAVYLGDAISRRSSGEYSERMNGREKERGGTLGPKKLSPGLSVASGFASARVGLGSPQLDFRRDWTGAGVRRREESSEYASINSAISENRSQVSTGSAERKENGTSNGLVDRVSGLPSPPSTESDIAVPDLTKSGSSTDTTTKAAGPSKKSTSPTRSAKRSSATSSPLHLSRRTSSCSGSGSSPSTSMRPADSPRLRTTGIRPKGSPSISSISRTSSSSSGLVLSLKPSRQASPVGAAKRQSSDMSRHSSQSSDVHDGSTRNSPTKRKQVQSLDLSRTSSFSSPERTARQILPQVENDFSDGDEEHPGHSRYGGQEKNGQRRTISPRKSPGTDLDDRIREAKEKAREASRNGRRRSVEITETYTPVRSTIRRHDSYSHAQPSPLASTSTLRRSATLSSASVLGNEEAQASLPSKRYNFQERRNTIGEEEEDKEKSGGSGSSRRRKALPADFRQSSLFTPSPPKPKYGDTPNNPPHSARSSRLRQFIDSPTDYPSSSPIPSRFASTSRLSGVLDQDQSVSLSRSRMGQHDGLERSASLAGSRGGETSGYSRRNWSQSISGLPRVNDELDHRGLPRYRAEANVQRGSLDSQITQSNNRRGQSMLVNDRDLSSASRLRVTSIAPGDSISAVGAGSDRADSKDPLDVVRRLEEQRVASRRRWHDIPRSATSMSSIKDVYNGAVPRTAPIERIASRISTDRDDHPSPSLGRGSSRVSMRGPATEPRPMRSSTSLGGRSSVILDIGSASTEHGRLLFEAFHGLDSRIGHEVAYFQSDLVRTFHSAARTTETINATLRNAVDLASQIAVDAELEDPERVREDCSRLALLLREAGKASDQSVRDLTRVMLDIPKLLRQGQGVGSGMTGSTSAGSIRDIRRAQSVSLAFDPIKPGPASEERARRWQPTSPINSNGFDRSPLREEGQGRERWSLDTPRRNSEMLRPATSIGESQSQSPLSRYNGNGRGEGGGGSTVASLMSRVRNMTPRKSLSSPKPELQTIQASPPQPQASPKNEYDDDTQSSIKSLPRSPERTSFRNVLKKKASTSSAHTVRGPGNGGGGSSFFPTVSRVGPTTAISQVTAGDPNPDMTTSRRSSIDEPNSPMSRFSFNRQKERIRPKLQDSNENEEDYSSSIHSNTRSPDRREREENEYFSAESYKSEREHNQSQSQSPYHSSSDSPRIRETSDNGTGGGGDAISVLEQNLVQAAKAREWEREQRGVRERLGITPQRPQRGTEGGLDRRPSLSDRFRATLRKSSTRAEG